LVFFKEKIVMNGAFWIEPKLFRILQDAIAKIQNLQLLLASGKLLI
jgi:hypothetical protein